MHDTIPPGDASRRYSAGQVSRKRGRGRATRGTEDLERESPELHRQVIVVARDRETPQVEGTSEIITRQPPHDSYLAAKQSGMQEQS